MNFCGWIILSVTFCIFIPTIKAESDPNNDEATKNLAKLFEDKMDLLNERLDGQEQTMATMKAELAGLKTTVETGSKKFQNFSSKMESESLVDTRNANSKISVLQQGLSHIKTYFRQPQRPAGEKIFFEDRFVPGFSSKWNPTDFTEQVFRDTKVPGYISGYANFPKTSIVNEKIVVQFSAIMHGKENCGAIIVWLKGCSPVSGSSSPPDLLFDKISGNSTNCGEYKDGTRHSSIGFKYLEPAISLGYWETGFMTFTYVVNPNKMITVKRNGENVYTRHSLEYSPIQEICKLEFYVWNKDHSIELLDLVFTNSETIAEKRRQQTIGLIQ